MSDCIPPAEIIGNSQVRALCGDVSRNTLITWRAEKAFPAPFKEIPAAGSPCELWDRREVRAWLKGRERAKRAAKRRAK